MARPTFPEVHSISDRAAQQSVKMLWDRMYSQQTTIDALQSTITSLQSTISSLQSTLASLERKVNIISSPASE